MKITRHLKTFSILIFFFCLMNNGYSQTNGHGMNGLVDTSAVEPMIELEEIALDTINIDAVIEKPRVAIVPKRLNPDMGELEFVDRSFDHELKSFPKKPLIKDDRLFKPQKIELITKKVLQEKANQNSKKKKEKRLKQ